MTKTSIDNFLDSVQRGDPSVRECSVVEMRNPFRDEFKKPSYGFFVERERPNVEESEGTWWNPSDPFLVGIPFESGEIKYGKEGEKIFKLRAKPGTVKTWPFSDELHSFPVDKEKAEKLRSKPDTFTYTMGPLTDELDAVPDPPSLIEKRKTRYYMSHRMIMLPKTNEEILDDMKITIPTSGV